MTTGRVAFVLCLVFSLLAAVPALAFKTNYVSTLGTNSVSPYTSWELATSNLQAAVADAAGGDTVLVTNGTYWTSDEIGITNTITVASVSGAGDTILARLAQGTNLPHHRVVKITANAVLDGFTVQGGYLPIAVYPAYALGGGVNMSAGTIQNCLITSNSLGNSWTSYGGGLYLSGSSKMLFCAVVSNSCGTGGGSGGGIYAVGNALLVSNSIAYNTGPGASLVNQPTAKFCVFENNNGSGVYGYSVTMSNCLIRYNTAGQGGGFYSVNGNTVLDTVIVSNTATTAGGGVYVSGAYSPLVFRRCVISANTNANYPGIYFATINPDNGTRSFELCRVTDNRGWRSVYVAAVPLPIRFLNCTIASDRGVGFEVSAVATNTKGALVYPVFLNTIVYNHTTNLFSTNTSLLADMLANSFTNSCSPQLTAPGFNNVAADPQFTAPAAGNYRLKRFSPCARSGMTNVLSLYKSDIELTPYGQTVNMGCYEALAKYAGGSVVVVR